MTASDGPHPSSRVLVRASPRYQDLRRVSPGRGSAGAPRRGRRRSAAGRRPRDGRTSRGRPSAPSRPRRRRPDDRRARARRTERPARRASRLEAGLEPGSVHVQSARPSPRRRSGPARPRARRRSGGGGSCGPTAGGDHARGPRRTSRTRRGAAANRRHLARPGSPGDIRRAGRPPARRGTAPPGLGRLDVVERVEVDVGDAHRRVRGDRREAVEQAVGPVEAAGPDEAGDEPRVLRQEAMRVGDADPGRDRQQLVRLGDPGQADVDRAGSDPRRGAPPATSRSRPDRSRAASSCSSRTRPCRASASARGRVRDERVALRVAGDADLGAAGGRSRPSRGAATGRRRSRRAPWRRRRPRRPGRRRPPRARRCRSAQVGAVADHPGGQVRHRAEPLRLRGSRTARRSPRGPWPATPSPTPSRRPAGRRPGRARS